MDVCVYQSSKAEQQAHVQLQLQNFPVQYSHSF